MLKGVIIDDEQSCRDSLENMVNVYCDSIEIVGKGESIREGLSLISKYKPDVVLLDIEMPLENGFKLFDYLDDINFKVIFTTAYDHYAIKAIKFSALDYLLKPIDIEELQVALSKLEKNSNEKINLLKENLDQQFQKIALPSMEGYNFVSLDQIIRCESSTNYTTFIMKDGERIIVSKPIKDFEELLNDFNFIRVHRSHVVNLNYIRKFMKGKHPKIIMDDACEINLSPIRKQAFMNKFLKI